MHVRRFLCISIHVISLHFVSRVALRGFTRLAQVTRPVMEAAGSHACSATSAMGVPPSCMHLHAAAAASALLPLLPFAAAGDRDLVAWEKMEAPVLRAPPKGMDVAGWRVGPSCQHS